jgi:hypothetical protein
MRWDDAKKMSSRNQHTSSGSGLFAATVAGGLVGVGIGAAGKTVYEHYVKKSSFDMALAEVERLYKAAAPDAQQEMHAAIMTLEAMSAEFRTVAARERREKTETYKDEMAEVDRLRQMQDEMRQRGTAAAARAGAPPQPAAT